MLDRKCVCGANEDGDWVEVEAQKASTRYGETRQPRFGSSWAVNSRVSPKLRRACGIVCVILGYARCCCLGWLNIEYIDEKRRLNTLPMRKIQAHRARSAPFLPSSLFKKNCKRQQCSARGRIDDDDRRIQIRVHVFSRIHYKIYYLETHNPCRRRTYWFGFLLSSTYMSCVCTNFIPVNNKATQRDPHSCSSTRIFIEIIIGRARKSNWGGGWMAGRQAGRHFLSCCTQSEDE